MRWARTRDFGRALFDRLFAPVDIASLIFFRVAFGIIAFLHVWEQIDSDRVRSRFMDPDFHFTFFGFGWVKPLPGDLMLVVFFAMAACSVLIALGLFYRAAIALFFLFHTYVFLIDAAAYWNHYYLVSLIAFLLIFIPANRAFSLDVALGVTEHSDDAPTWGLWILRAQMGIVYFFARLSKVSGDWLRAHLWTSI